jgi:hypothetical protein
MSDKLIPPFIIFYLIFIYNHMNKLSSPSGIALIASISVVVVSMVGFTAYKYMGNDTEEIPRTSSDSEPRSSSMFSMLEEERGSSMSEQNENYKLPYQEVSDKNIPKKPYGNVKIIGGKRSKKRKRKNKSKKRNTLKK